MQLSCGKDWSWRHERLNRLTINQLYCHTQIHHICLEIRYTFCIIYLLVIHTNCITRYFFKFKFKRIKTFCTLMIKCVLKNKQLYIISIDIASYSWHGTWQYLNKNVIHSIQLWHYSTLNMYILQLLDGTQQSILQFGIKLHTFICWFLFTTWYFYMKNN